MPSSSWQHSSSSDVEKRFGDLLHPCSDINKNWSIDVGEILKSYLAELAHVNIDLEHGGYHLNFAEAALLIQGSTCVFGKKVEYLYTLTNQLACQLHNEKEITDSNADPGKTRDTALVGRGGVTEFVAVDHISRSNNLNIKDDVSSNKDCVIQRGLSIPLALVPLDSNEKGNLSLYNTKGEDLGKKSDYQLNLCSITDVGCLLLPANTDFMGNDESYENEEDDMDMVEDEHELQDTDNDCSPPDDDIDDLEFPSSRPDVSSEVGCTISESFPELDSPTLAKNSRKGLRRSLRQQKKALEAEMEKQRKEDENKKAWEVNGKNEVTKKPIQKKNVRKLPKKIMRKQQGEQEDDSKTISTLAFCSKNFFSSEDVLKKIGGVVNKVTVNPAFEQLVAKRYKEQEAAVKTCRKKLKLEDPEVKDEPMEEITDGGDDAGGDTIADDNGSVADDNDSCPLGNDVDLPSDVGNSDEASPFVYEELVNQHVDNYMKHIAQFCQTTELTERVNEWEKKIKPQLEREKKREVFNIHVYGTRILDEFEDSNRKQTLPFKNLCKKKRRWEVCRYFLASLQLANNSNVEISTSQELNGLHNMELTLLSRKRHQEQLDEFGHSTGEH